MKLQPYNPGGDSTLFNTRVTNVNTVARMLRDAAKVPGLVFDKRELKKRLETRFKKRLDELGSTTWSGRDPEGNRWFPLAVSTNTWKQNHGYGDKPTLQQTGNLRRAIQVVQSSWSPTMAKTSTGAGFRIGINPGISYKRGKRTYRAAEYGALHNYGRGRIIERRFLGIGKGEIESVDRWIELCKKRAGLK